MWVCVGVGVGVGVRVRVRVRVRVCLLMTILALWAMTQRISYINSFRVTIAQKLKWRIS